MSDAAGPPPSPTTEAPPEVVAAAAPNDPSAAPADDGQADASVDAPGAATTDTALESTPETPVETPVDLDAIERDLTAVETALGRLADGTYWTDEVTGHPLPESMLEHDPTVRRV
ncbi:MAG: hypothetical protein WBP59_02865 [Ilumatobacteraceae bacterium]